MEALWYKKKLGKSVACQLCPRKCLIKNGQPGHCLGRVNHNGTLLAQTYARPASIALDPVEKKPLYHFYPNKNILSLGTYGCNLSCQFCQNWSLSQEKNNTDELLVEDALRLVKGRRSIGIAYTYNEPTVWFEYVLACAKALHEKGFKNVLVTNGYIEEKPIKQLLPFIDAMNIDIKSFSNKFYREICAGKIAPVLQTAKLASTACHLEITHLVIPGQNDQAEEQSEMAQWINRELGESTPVHLSAYTPRYKLKAKATEEEDLVAARKRFLKHLTHVYIGNLYVADCGTTYCPGCKKEIIRRIAYTVEIINLGDNGRCRSCGFDLNIIN